MSEKTSYKGFLVEYYKFYRSFSEVVDKEDDDDTKDKKKRPKNSTSSSELEQRVDHNEEVCDDAEEGDDETDYDPCEFRRWMELSIAGNS